MTPTEASRAALRNHARQRSTDVRRRIDKALRDLRKQGAAININTVAHRAGVTRKTIYGHKDLLARIRAHTQLAPAPETREDTGSNGIIAALRHQLTAKDTQIAELKAKLRDRDSTIATLYGQLEHQNPRPE